MGRLRHARRMSGTLGIKLDYSQRKFSDDFLNVYDIKNHLSEFQIEKLTYLFRCFNQTNSGYIEEEDIENVNEMFRNIAGWERDDLNYISMVDNNRVFLECLFQQVQRERAPVKENLSWEEARRPSKISVASVSLKNWLNMWARLSVGSSGMDDFPIWVQCLPKVLFNVIVGREGTDFISKDALKTFYEKFAGLTGTELEETAEYGFNTATDNGDYKLDYPSYKLLFANFLLGKTIHGPGKYIFGVFDNRDAYEPYKVDFDI